MKKFVILLFVAMAALSVKAQVYVGGTVSLWHNDDADATAFTLNPEVGYNLNEKLAVGGILTFAHSKLDEGKYNAFGIAPYLRYSYYENKIVRLFVDGGLGFSTQKVKGFDAVNGFEIGFKPGIAIKLNDKFSLVAKCGFLGYRDDYMNVGSGYGFNFKSEDLSFGFHYEF
ncbi:outer membrane beta-barrel protein [uncultured Bacteroides sp.]|uniref:outer membrane beta-barrel protein n=2 Tax=uncultured Bacteroides sp. TaxID=162156 RepID=UPI0025FC5A94|nr:outer membrane beta-barrel protein [uncultured Bacteroides sp.]